MGTLTSTLVMRLVDGVTAVAPKIRRGIASVDAAARGTERRAAVAERKQLSAVGATIRSLAGVTAGVTAAQSVVEYAALERRMTRVALTADASAAAQEEAFKEVQKIAQETAQPIDGVLDGLEALVAQGKTLPEAMSFLPSVARTAQASGAAVNDIANSAGAVADQLGIAADRMQAAFDVMVAGGKAGKFELRDMAQYLPSIAPMAAAIGLKGEEGLRKLVAMLQVVRNQTGTSSEAATALSDVFSKMETDETANKFKKFGINLRKEMAAARKEGKPLLETFIELSERALKGDLSKIPQLFGDREFQRGMRALLSQKDALADLVRLLNDVDGVTLKDFGRVADDTQGSVDRLKNSWDALVASIGKGADAAGVDNLMQAVSAAVDEVSAAVKEESKPKKHTPGGRTHREAEERSMREANMTPSQRDMRNVFDVGRAISDQYTEFFGDKETTREEFDRLMERRDRNRRQNMPGLGGLQEAFDRRFLDPRIEALEKRLKLDAAPTRDGRKIVPTEEVRGLRTVPGGFASETDWSRIAPHDRFSTQRPAVPDTPTAHVKPDIELPQITGEDLTEAGRRMGETFVAGMRPAMQEAVALAEQTGHRIQQALSVTATPRINMPNVNRALGSAAQDRMDASFSDGASR